MSPQPGTNPPSAGEAFLPGQGRSPGRGHFAGKSLPADLVDPVDAGGAVGAEDEAEQPADQSVVAPALARVGVGRTIRAGGKTAADATGAHLAPGSLRVFAAARAASGNVGLAGAAIESAVGDEVRVCRHRVHADQFSRKGGAALRVSCENCRSRGGVVNLSCHCEECQRRSNPSVSFWIATARCCVPRDDKATKDSTSL